MVELYFSKPSNIISFLLILSFAVYFSVVISKRSTISNWGILVLVLFVMGLFMSIMSGTRDSVGTAQAIFTLKSTQFILLSVLGGIAFLAGIIMMFVRKQDFWQFGFYVLSAIIIIKTLMVEISRIMLHLKA